jgi:gliding motility-associated-like protein
MNIKWQVLLLIVLVFSIRVSAFAEGDGSRIFNPAHDTVFYCGNPVAVAPLISVQNLQSKNASEGIKISVVNYQKGHDTLIYQGNRFSPRWNNDAGFLELLGAGNAAELEEAVRLVYYNNLRKLPAADTRTFAITLLDSDYLPYTGHFYRYIRKLDISWTEARDSAAKMTYHGLKGYLATITSAIENDFIWTKTDGVGWIGASDAEVEGDWKWVTGPEAGTLFWRGNANGYRVNGQYSNWATGEPNNSGPEHYAHINQNPQKEPKSWNDLKEAGDGPQSQYYRPKGFVVEFGGMPGDPEIHLYAIAIVAWKSKPQMLIHQFDSVICGNLTYKLSLSFSEKVDVMMKPLQSKSVVRDPATLSPTIEVEEFGDYRFEVEMTSRYGCAYYDTIIISFRHKPVVDFYIDEEECRGYNLNVLFTGKVEGKADFYWYTADTVFRSGSDLTEVVIPLGYGQRNRYVRLDVNENGCMSSFSEPVSVTPAMDFWVEGDHEGCTPLLIQFKNKDIEEIDSYAWYFGDGLYSTDKSPAHTYINRGTTDLIYDVMLRVVSMEGCENEGVLRNAVTVHPIPTLDLNFVEDGCYPEQGIISYIGSAGIRDSMKWDLSDFDAEEITELPGSLTDHFQYKLSNRPQAVAGLHVISEYGCRTDTLWRVLRRKPLINMPADTVSGCPPLNVHLSLLASDPVDEVKYTWNLGNGTTATGEIISHIYDQENSHLDMAIYANSQTTGCKDTLLLPGKIFVHPVPNAAFTANAYEVLISDSRIYFENRSSGSTFYEWDFGDLSALSVEEHPVHRYEKMGQYEVSLLALNKYGCSDSVSTVVSVTFDKVFPPTAFSPNAPDEVDREFRIHAEGIVNEGYKMLMYNRWGQVVFETYSQNKGWDGRTKNGSNAPAGAYTWILQYYDFLGKKHTQHGTVTLIF